MRCEAALQASFRDGAMGRANVDGLLIPRMNRIGRPATTVPDKGDSMKTDRSLESILKEFDIEIIDCAQNRRRTARQTCASQTLENIRRRRGCDHLRSVLMSIVETKPNELALVAPVILAVSDVLRSYPNWIGETWFHVMDSVDLVEMFNRASANRRIALPRHAIATQLFERMRQQFPYRDRGTTSGLVRLRQPDQPARRMAA